MAAARAGATRPGLAGCALVAVLLGLACGQGASAALLPAPDSPGRPEAPRPSDGADPAWVSDTLRPSPPTMAVDSDPLQLDPQARPAVPEWLDRAPDDGERPSASVRNLYPDLPIHPAFPQQGLNFEEQPSERLALPELAPSANRGDGGPPELSDVGKSWLLRHADAAQVVQIKQWRSWLSEHRTALMLALVAALVLAFGLSLRRRPSAGGRSRARREHGDGSRRRSSHSRSHSRSHADQAAGEAGGRSSRSGGSQRRSRDAAASGLGDGFASTLADSSFERGAAARGDGHAPAPSARPTLPPDPSLRPKRHRGSGRSRSRSG